MLPRGLLAGVLSTAIALAGDGPATLADRTGSLFTAPPPAPLEAVPDVERVRFDAPLGGDAIWGALGRDRRGHVWFAVSTNDTRTRTAHLYEYAPATGRVADRGDVIGALERCGRLRPGESQSTIHTRILHADDGHLYFASLDGSRIPVWGSHLWRLHTDDGRWEHVLAMPGGLIALAGAGPLLYGLSYPNHVLHQYDVRTGKHRFTPVGCPLGHVSRNLVATPAGHAFVPRIRTNERGGIEATLVEYDASLREVAKTPLRGYGGRGESHGITGLVYLRDQSVVFTTGAGAMYRIRPNGSDRVRHLGWFHPNGTAYAPALFTLDKERYVVGVARHGRRNNQWVVFDLETNEARAHNLSFEKPLRRPLVYGSITRDDSGAFYAGGLDGDGERSFPVLLRLRY